ncbi:type VI secretion system-associated FHA domain protein TagH [Marinimicrobium sp. ARAG 43.8]|uniref:type VI secretion system-associated FHA domain protein TagH n=1 Tax=Marinimicrobium sp. ARAG 43.8 TaxID=3418719 RepID=UPI003CF19E92
MTKAPDGTHSPKTLQTLSEQGGTLGRASDNTLVLPDSERILSGRHCEFVFRAGQYQLVDLSTNGTFVNHSAEPIGKGIGVPVKPGDVIEVGDYCFVVEMPDSSGMESPFSDVEGLSGDKPEPGLSSPDRDEMAQPFGVDVYPPEPVASDVPLDPLRALGGAAPSEPPTTGALDDRELFDDLMPYGDPAVCSAPSLVPSAGEELENPAQAAIQWPESVPESLIPDDWLDEPFVSDVETLSEKRQQASVGELSAADSPSEPISSGAAAVPKPGEPVVRDSDMAKSRPASEKQNTPDRSCNALYDALGVDADSLDAETRQGLEPLLGAMLREVVDGLMKVLRSRASIKNEFRMNVTTMQPVENNPLKFSADVDEALENILLRRSQAYKEPLAAVREGFQEVAEHQLAMIAGMRSAFEHMLRDFDPKRLQSLFEQQRKPSTIGPIQRARLWQQYCDYYQGLTDNMERSFQQVFGDEFVQAYQDQLRRLSALRPS